MQNFFQKIVGWALVAVGVGLVFWSIWSAFSVFTAKKEAPQVFVISEKQESIKCPETAAIKGSQEEIQAQVEKMLQGQLKEQIQQFLPADFITRILNLGVYGALTALLIFAGGKVSGIGIRLLKNNKDSI